MNSTNYCRERAAACERLAAIAKSPEAREIMLYLARRWRFLAQQDESELNPPPVRGRSQPLCSARQRAPMTTARELRAEAERMREFALSVADPKVLEEIQLMISELERRARELGDGGDGAG